MSKKVIKMGDTITYVRNEVAATATVVAIDKCPRRRDMFGVKVAEIEWEERDFGFLKLDNGGYCYGLEVSDVVPPLSDAVVDAFLQQQAGEPSDPVRVERIRELYEAKKR